MRNQRRAAAGAVQPEIGSSSAGTEDSDPLNKLLDVLDLTVAQARRAGATSERGRAALLVVCALDDLSGEIQQLRAEAQRYLGRS